MVFAPPSPLGVARYRFYTSQVMDAIDRSQLGGFVNVHSRMLALQGEGSFLGTSVGHAIEVTNGPDQWPHAAPG